MHVIYEGILAEGDYIFDLKVKDGSGNYVDYSKTEQIHVQGGDTYAQTIFKDISIDLLAKWKAGYITIEGKILKNNQVMAYGAEQVLLKNRASFKNDLDNINSEVYEWPAADQAIQETGATARGSGYSVIFTGAVPNEKTWNPILEKTWNP